MLATLVTLCCLSVAHALPIVDAGLFVIMGVNSCREGSGYCLLGVDCTLDKDFLPDDRGGHCDGLRSAFTPSANFICCRYNARSESSSSDILLSMYNDNIDYLTTESTTVQQELHENVLDEESPTQVLIKRNAEASVASLAVLSVNGILSRLPFVTEVNLELIVHNNVQNRSVNNVTTAAPADQDINTLDMSSQSDSPTESMTTTERQLNLQNTEHPQTEHKDFEIVIDPCAFIPRARSLSEDSRETTDVPSSINTDMETTQLHLTSPESSSSTQGQPRSNSEDSTDVPSSINTDMETSQLHLTSPESSSSTQGQPRSNSEDSTDVPLSTNTDMETTDVDLATTEPIRDNEISMEPEDTPTTMTCSVPVDKNCWLVNFLNDTDVMCVGSFVRKDIILTSGSCVSRVFRMGLAGLTLQTLGGAVVSRNLIRDVFVHEEYDVESTHVALNDIGMVRLISAVKVTPSICSLCLPNSESELMDKPCDRVSKKYNKTMEFAGSPMVCQGGTLGGLVSVYSAEPVYTPISDYLPWIRHNMDTIPLEWRR